MAGASGRSPRCHWRRTDVGPGQTWQRTTLPALYPCQLCLARTVRGWGIPPPFTCLPYV